MPKEPKPSLDRATDVHRRSQAIMSQGAPATG